MVHIPFAHDLDKGVHDHRCMCLSNTLRTQWRVLNNLKCVCAETILSEIRLILTENATILAVEPILKKRFEIDVFRSYNEKLSHQVVRFPYA